MRRLLGLLVLLLLPLGLRAGWLELGSVAIRRVDREIEVRQLTPAEHGASATELRLLEEGGRSERLGPGERLFLVSFKHEDPRRELARVARLLVDAGGTLLVAADGAGLAAIEELAHSDHGHPHLIVRPAPEAGVVVRRWGCGSPAPSDPQIASAVDLVDGELWWSTVETLVAFPTRNSKTQGIWDAAEWTKGRFEALGIPVAVEPFPFSGGEAPNVVARLHGGDDKPILLIGAHLDSINYGGQTAPGADDNASGSAGVLEAARVLAAALPDDPGVEIRFALFSGEEQGLYGSKFMAREMAESGEIERLVAMINLDMIAFDQGGSLDVTLESEEFNQDGLDRMAALAAQYTELNVGTTTHAWGSDHVPFLQRNVKAILPIEGEYDDNPHDHTGHDVIDNLNKDLAVQILRLVVASSLDTVAANATSQVQVTLRSGESPVGGVALLQGSASQVRLEIPADSGTVTGRVTPGAWTLSVQAFGYLSPAPRSFEVAVDQTHAEAFELEVAPVGPLAGTVRSAEGQGVAAVLELPGTPVEPVQAADDGSFFLSLPHGTYTLQASALGFHTASLDGVTVPSEGVEVTLQPVPPTLLVDDDGGKAYEQYFEAALADLGEEFLKKDAASLGAAADLAPFSTIVWLCGDRYDGIFPETIRPILREYVAAGGRLIVSGQDVGYGLKSTEFYAQTLGAKFVKDTAGSKQVGGAGLSFALGGDGAGNQKYPDVVQAEGEANLWLEYGSGEGAAVWNPIGEGRVVYLGFGLEGVDSAENRRALMGACLQAGDAAGARRRLLSARWLR